MPPHAPLAALLALAAAACADIFGAENADVTIFRRIREVKAQGAAQQQLPAGCLHEGRWFVEGALVPTRAACLRCRCGRGALACAHRACAAPPDPPPRRCHLRTRRGACCPELHCPDGVTVLEHSASARFDDDLLEVAASASAAHACAEGGALFAAGSAMAGRAACEQCFCLRGRRRCVRPRCPPPAGCRAAPPACCPPRYLCAAPPRNATGTGPHDCEVAGSRVPEGERVRAAEGEACTRCFCLRGRPRCRPLACAPPLGGCTPLLRAGHCCPHQYRCNHTLDEDPSSHHVSPILHNALISSRYEDRSLDTSESKNFETTPKTLSTSHASNTNTIPEPSTKEQHVSTSKVKRKTSDSPRTTVTHQPKQNITVATTKSATKGTEKTTTKPIHKQTTKSTPTTLTTTTTTSTTTSTTTEAPTTATSEVSSTSPATSTEQPEGTVRIMINGTINCTAELSHSPLNKTANETQKGPIEALPQTPDSSGAGAQTQTPGPVDIITDRNVNGGFEENETFTINVTSSLRTNHSRPAAPSPAAPAEGAPEDLSETLNISKKNKQDYDYDYTEPTLPPSLPNLKIIPFVAADAVVDEDAGKGAVAYPAVEREDKFPVYYPSKDSEPPFATRREDVFPPHAVFNKERYPPHSQAAAAPPAPAYTHVHNELPPRLHELSLSAALESRVSELHQSTAPPSSSATSGLDTPAVNLFSPPVETEGGFIPKGPGIIDEYYAVYPSTPLPPSLPHLTTSMPLDSGAGDCFSSDGRVVRAGAAVERACAVCACAWGELHCAPRACARPPPGCRRAAPRPPALCCGRLVCHRDDNSTTVQPEASTRRNEVDSNATEVPVEIPSDVVPFDPPPDRREPATDRPVATKAMQETDSKTTTAKVIGTANDITGSNDDETFKRETDPASSSTPIVTSEKSTTALSNFTIAQEVPESAEGNATGDQSQEYEDEEEDEGFSFGSVLKLLLSDSYESTAAPPPKKKPPATTTPAYTVTTTASPKLYSTTRKILPKPTVAPFVPLPNNYVPPKRAYRPNTINRIDHLVLGEATAIRKPTPRPVSATPRPATATLEPYTEPNSPRPLMTMRPAVTKKEEHQSPSTSVSHEAARPAGAAAAAGPGGLLKLAGCNIYGQMYRVGRIIAELSTPCQECRCTELGVSCRALAC